MSGFVARDMYQGYTLVMGFSVLMSRGWCFHWHVSSAVVRSLLPRASVGFAHPSWSLQRTKRQPSVSITVSLRLGKESSLTKQTHKYWLFMPVAMVFCVKWLPKTALDCLKNFGHRHGSKVGLSPLCRGSGGEGSARWHGCSCCWSSVLNCGAVGEIPQTEWRMVEGISQISASTSFYAIYSHPTQFPTQFTATGDCRWKSRLPSMKSFAFEGHVVSPLPHASRHWEDRRYCMQGCQSMCCAPCPPQDIPSTPLQPVPSPLEALSPSPGSLMSRPKVLMDVLCTSSWAADIQGSHWTPENTMSRK